MTGLLGLGTPETLPNRQADQVRLGANALVLSLHVVVILSLMHVPRYQLSVSSGGSGHGGIAAFVSGPSLTGTTGTIPQVQKVTRAKAVTSPHPAQATEASGDGGQGGGTATGGGDGSGGPVRIGSGITAISKVNPIYPPIMERARMQGVVVLDAIIHRDGSVGEIKVLQSSAPAFEQSAIAAVSQWRYSPIPYEGILTVTVNFTLSR